MSKEQPDKFQSRLSEIIKKFPRFQIEKEESLSTERQVKPAVKKDHLDDFLTFNDPCLINFVKVCKEWRDRLYKQEESMITFCGSYGIGKSYMKTLLCRSLANVSLESRRAFGAPDCLKFTWRTLLSELESKHSDTIWKVRNCGILAIEEFIPKYNNPENGWTELRRDLAREVVVARAGKATIFETNRRPSEIHSYDEAIYSKLTRDHLSSGVRGIIVDLFEVQCEYQDRLEDF